MKQNTARRGRPRTHTTLICKATRERIARESAGNLGAWRRKYTPAIGLGAYYRAMRGEAVPAVVAQLIENT